MTYLSIIIPAYNEEKRIGATLSQLYNFLKAKEYEYEVILVDDGSVDSTVLEAQASDLYIDKKLSVLKSGTNKGKGAAVREGILRSKGEYILFTDADLSTAITELDSFFGYMKKGYDIIIGSRARNNSSVRARQPWYREGMGKVFNFFVKILLIKDFSDTQCGFKFFKGETAKKLAELMKIDGFCFDVEMLYLAKLKGYNIYEAGVTWENSPESKVRLIKSSLSMFLDLFKIRNMHKNIRFKIEKAGVLK